MRAKNTIRRAFLSVELSFVIVALAIILGSAIGLYYTYSCSKIKDYSNLNDVHYLLDDIQKNIEKYGYPSVSDSEISFNVDDSCKLKYEIDTDENDVVIYTDTENCDDLNVRNLYITNNIEDAVFEEKDNNIFTLTINKNKRKYPYIFYFYKKNYN